MNLFTARLTGKMLSTDQFEKSIQDMINRVNRWRQIEKSPELAEYLKLKEIVESAKFQQTKQELSERKYKDTEEGKKMSAFEKLSSTLRIKGYKYALENPTFQAFLKFRDSDDFHKMQEVQFHCFRRVQVIQLPCSPERNIRKARLHALLPSMQAADPSDSDCLKPDQPEYFYLNFSYSDFSVCGRSVFFVPESSSVLLPGCRYHRGL